MDSSTLMSIIIPVIMTGSIGLIGAFTARNTAQINSMETTIKNLQAENARLTARVEKQDIIIERQGETIDRLEAENSDLRDKLERRRADTGAPGNVERRR